MIGNRKKIKSGINFDIKSALKKDIHNLYKFYYVIAILISPIFAFVLFEYNSKIKNIYFDLAIPLLFLITLLLSFKYEWVNKRIKPIFFVYCLFLSLYTYLIYADSGYTFTNFLGYIIAYFAIIVGINDHRLSLIYSLLSLALISITHYIIPNENNIISLEVELSAFGIIGFVGFIIHYNSYSSIKRILYNDGLLQNILNTTSDAVFLLNENENIIDWNKKTETIFKINNKNTFKEKSFKDVFHLRKISNGNLIYTLDNYTVVGQTEISTIEYNNNTFHIVKITDISEEVKKTKELDQIKKRLIESEKTYRELFDNSYELIFITDDEFNIIDINKQTEKEIINLKEDWLGFSFVDLLDDSNEDLISNLKNSTYKGDINTISLNKKFYDINIRITNFYDVDHYVISARSAESRIKFERQISESRDRMSLILNNINSIVYYEECDGKTIKLRYISPKIESIIGLSVDDFITYSKSGKLKELYHPDDLKLVLDKRKYTNSTFNPVDFVYRIRKGKEYIYLEERIYPKQDEKGNHTANFGIITDVTQAYIDKIAIEKSNKRNREFIERNLAGFFRISIDKTILDCNNSFARIFGFLSAEQLIGKNINDIYKDSSDRDSFISNLRKNKVIINNESIIILKNNTKIHVLENASLVYDDNGNEIIESTIFDISAIKNIEIELERSQNALSLVLNNISDLVYNIEFDKEMKAYFNFLGTQVQSITGYSLLEFIDIVQEEKLVNIIHNDDREFVTKKVKEMYDGGGEIELIYRIIRKDKQEIWVEENIIPQYEKGKIKQTFGVIREVTERKKYEKALVDSENKYRELVEKNVSGVFRTTIGGTILDCNQAFVDIFGYESIEEIKSSKSLNLYFKNEDREKYIKDLIQHKTLYNYELLHKRKNGSKVWVIVNVTILNNDLGEPEIIQGTLIDITKDKEKTEALKDSEEKFRLLFEATNDAIFILEEGNIIDCNNKSMSTFACDVKQKNERLASGMSLIKLSPKTQPDGLLSEEKLKQKIQDTLKGNSQMFYWRFVRMDEQFFDAEVSMNLFYLGEKHFVQVVVRDITSRMKAEIALRESEERFKLLSNSTIEGIVFSEDGKIIDANDQFAIMHGYESSNKVIGKFLFEFLYSHDDIEKVNKVIKTNSEEKFEVRSKHLDGRLIWLESKGRIIPYHGRRIRVSVIYDITDRKIKEEELQKSRKSFMDLTELSPNGSIIHIDGIIEYANPQVIKFFGFKNLEEVVGKNIYDFLRKEDIHRSLERIEKIKKGENVGFAEFMIKDKKGNDREIGVQSVLIDYKGKKAVHVIISDLGQQKELQKEKLRAQLAEETNILLEKEIQERKEAELRLWETQMFTTNMLNSSIDMIMASDKSNLITQVNNAVLKIFGYKTEEIIGLHPKYLYADEKEFDRVKDDLFSKGSYSGEIINKRKNGEFFTSYLSASILKNTQGKIIGTMGVSRDITLEQEAQRKIEEQNAQIRSIFDSASNILIWTIDKDFNLKSFNHNFKETIRYHFDVEVKIGDKIINVITKHLRPNLLDYSIDIIKETFNGKHGELEGPFYTIHKNTLWIETFLSPIQKKDGSIEEISCISHEITEKKETENQIRQSLKEKEVLLKEVHHRVKNNLQVISSILNLQSSYVKDDKTLSILRESQNRIKSMSFIHESLYQTKNFSYIDFSEYIMNLSNNLFHSYQIFDNFIDLIFEIEPVKLNLDQAIPCGLIVNELITNAMKYAFKGRKKGKLLIGLKEEKGKINLRIEDNGVGLPKGFNPEKSASLGLQLVVTLVEQLDGELEINNKKGTKYLITFDKLN